MDIKWMNKRGMQWKEILTWATAGMSFEAITLSSISQT